MDIKIGKLQLTIGALTAYVVFVILVAVIIVKFSTNIW